MKLCILCEDANIEEARQRSLSAIPNTNSDVKNALLQAKGVDPETKAVHLTIPVSPTGELPATHWFCFITVNSEIHQRMLDNQKHTIIEEGSPSEFLEKYGLKRIKSTSKLF